MKYFNHANHFDLCILCIVKLLGMVNDKLEILNFF